MTGKTVRQTGRVTGTGGRGRSHSKHIINTLISRSSGIDPMYLDSGVDGFVKYGRFVLREPVHLACSAAKELTAGAEKALGKLREADSDEFREIIAGCFAAYKDLKKNETVISENGVCHAWEIAAIMSVYLWTLQEKTRNKIEVLYRRKINLGIPVNIYRELVMIIECRK